jgi:SsrA-binding protein
MKENELVSNRKAFHDYEVLETYEAGLVLLGSEIKSLRNHGGSLQDSYIEIKNNEMWLLNCHISQYSFSTSFVHEERRRRKLLMHKSEILKLHKKVKEKGLALIPLSIFLKNRKAKVKVAVAKGKKAHDKRAKMKEKEHKKQIQKAIKSY